MRIIDADALWKAFTSADKDDIFGIEDIEQMIESAPTIDLVRCAECRWSRPRTLKGETGYRCVFYRVDKAETGYCDCGERKESE